MQGSNIKIEHFVAKKSFYYTIFVRNSMLKNIVRFTYNNKSFD